MYDVVFEAFRWLLGQFRIDRELLKPGQQLPHFVFIRCIKNRSTFMPKATPISMPVFTIWSNKGISSKGEIFLGSPASM